MKARAFAKAPPNIIAILAILYIDVFRQDLLLNEVLSGHLSATIITSFPVSSRPNF